MIANATITDCRLSDHKEETQNTDGHNTIKVKHNQLYLFLIKMIAKLKRTRRATPQNKDKT